MKCRLSCDASWPQNRPLGTFGGPLQWRVSGKASIHYGRVYFHKPSVKPFRFFFLTFSSCFYCVSSIIAAFRSLHFLFFVVCEFFRIWWLNTNAHRVLPTVMVQIRAWRQPKTKSPRQPTGATTFFQACLNPSMNGAISGRGRAGAEKRGRFMVKR